MLHFDAHPDLACPRIPAVACFTPRRVPTVYESDADPATSQEFDYKNLIKMKAPTESAKKKIEKIKKIYKANEQMKKEGKDPFVERQPFDV